MAFSLHSVFTSLKVAFGRYGIIATAMLTLAVPTAVPAKTPANVPLTAKQGGAQLDRLLKERLALYNETFSDVHFVQLPGGIHWLDSVQALRMILGEGAINLDYEHPPDLREQLLYAATQRVISMLRNNEASSALFRVAETSRSPRPNVCVLTLDPLAVARDDSTSTAYLLNFAAEALNRIPLQYRLQHRAFLRFVIDHEVFHCLEAMYLGPIPMSNHDHWAQYMLYRNEQAADAFAVAMHMREHGTATGFAGNLARIRALSLFNGDPEHLTPDAIRSVASEEMSALDAMSVAELVSFAGKRRDQLVLSYHDYLRFRAAACRVMAEIDTLPSNDTSLCEAASADRLHYRRLRNSHRRSFDELFLGGDPRTGQ